jgi:general secretion pathway protein G
MFTPRAAARLSTDPITGIGEETIMSRRNVRGFTLIEMVIVFTLIGILVGLALPQYQNATKKARESVLKETLFQMRKLIDQYYSDKSKYPASLQALVDENYLRKIPTDPITGKSDAWVEIKEQPAVDELEPGQSFGVVDIHSSSEEKSLDGTPYNTW